jgi:hypothetical protein
MCANLRGRGTLTSDAVIARAKGIADEFQELAADVVRMVIGAVLGVAVMIVGEPAPFAGRASLRSGDASAFATSDS